jgi:ribosomal-protein-serine acetyltransferase
LSLGVKLCLQRYGARSGRSTEVKQPILRDFPECFETERLLICCPMPGDDAKGYAAIVESVEELKPWMPWARQELSVEVQEENVRRARVAFLSMLR